MPDLYQEVALNARVRAVRVALHQRKPCPKHPREIDWKGLMDEQLKENNKFDLPKEDRGRTAFEAVLREACEAIHRDGLFPDGWDAWPPISIAPAH